VRQPKFFLPLLALAIATATVCAEIKISGKTETAANTLVRLEATGDVTDAALIWDVNDEERADVEECGKRLLFTGPAGTYKVKLRAVRLAGGKASVETARVTITIGEPVPPVPPGPPIPPPSDPFVQALQAAYTADAGTDKAASLQFLQAAYVGMAGQAPSKGLATNAEALAWMRQVIEAPGLGLTATQLAGLRRVIAADFAQALGTGPATALNVPLFVTELNKAALALKGVK
jgi:hypothetical protein